MPFQSKAQQRLFFAKNPTKAREWAHETKDIASLPEKKHPQVNPERRKLETKVAAAAAAIVEKLPSSGGDFFDKRATPGEGHFFRDLAGRDDGLFAKEAFNSYAPGQAAKSTATVNAGATGKPMGGQGFQGAGMGGGLYGTGEGEKKSDATEQRESDEERLKRLLGNAGPGKERTANKEDQNEEESEKTAGKTPNEWDAESGLPTGFHRPAYEQPAALEPGGTRFHSTEAKGPAYGTGGGIQNGNVGSRMSMRATSGHQMGKHASIQYLGTSFEKRGYVKERGEELGESAEEGLRWGGRRVDEAVKSVTRSPGGSLAALGLMGILGHRAGKGGLKRVGKLFKKAPVKAAPKGVREHLGAASKAVKHYFTKK